MSLFASSSSSDSSSVEYEVFISFRGSDTRYAFTSHLYEALSQSKIVTFIDYKIPSGDGISSALLDAIKKSKAAVVIFSKDYASSPWCLDELVEILKWNKIVIPVFYHVNPTDVEEQTGSYAASFVVHKTNGIHDERLQNWKKALKKASYQKGLVTTDIRDEALLMKKIVDDVWKKLRVTYKIDNKNLVGINPKVEKIKSLLNMGTRNVCVVGIWGIGGIGKTTLANAVFNEIQTQFEGSCFLRNIREELEKDVERLRQRLYYDISGEEIGKIVDYVRLNLLLSRMKVLIVFDDVTDLKQIKKIVGDVNSFNRESRFIITSRDKQLLRNCDCKEEKIYEVKGLCDQEAHQLFSMFAFKQEHPLEDHTELSWKMVDYAKGSPLALELLGSSLSTKNIVEWESAIEELKRAPNQEIQSVLKVSYNGLDNEQKNVFLDVACFFKGKHRKYIANLYDHSREFILSTLIDRCLVSADLDGWITMHDLLQEMGLQIVREESKYLGERSRLWDYDDICQVLTGNEGTRKIEGISLDIPRKNTIRLNKNPFINMSELWFLNIWPSSKENLCCPEDFQCLSTKLRVLCWKYYPLKSLKSRFNFKNLVILRIFYSGIEQLWDGVQPLPNLKEIHVNSCKKLTAIPDLSSALKLEKIDLSACESLTSLPPCNLLPNLKEIHLSDCCNLTAIPDLSLAEKLEEIKLCGCESLTSLPPCNVKKLSLRETNDISRLPSLLNPSKLQSLDLQGCDGPFFDRTSLSLSVSGSQLAEDALWSYLLILSNLSNLDLSCCIMVELPDTICQLSSLEYLNLSSTDLDKLPENIMQLSKLETLRLDYCRDLQFLPELPGSLKYLDAVACSSLRAVPDSLSTLLATTKSVCFSVCRNLNKNAFTTIIHDGLLEIQRWFREGSAQAIEGDGDGHAFSDLSYICYPGCEIPKFFEFQHLGSMISKELSHDMISGKIVGFAFCVVCKCAERLGFIDSSPRLHINFHREITFENGDCFPLPDELVKVPTHFIGCFAGDEYKEVVVGYTHMSDHRTFPSQYRLELKFSFYSSSLTDFEVEKCGFHLFSRPVSEEEGKGTSSSCTKGKQLETIPKGIKILRAFPSSSYSKGKQLETSPKGLKILLASP